MLIGGIIAGLGLGLLAGGDILNLARVRLRWTALIFVALLGRYVTEAALTVGVGAVETLRLPLYLFFFGLLLAGLWANRRHPGITLAFTGIASNTLVVFVNGGHMTVWSSALAAAGFTAADLGPAFHVIIPAQLDSAFITRLGFLGDVIPIPLPFIRNVVSLGDIFLSSGLALFLFGTVLGRGTADQAIRATVWRRRRSSGSGLAAGLSEAATLERSLVLGAGASGSAVPSRGLQGGPGSAAAAGPFTPSTAAGRGAGATTPVFPALPRIAERIREHPYVKLSLNSSFSALWAGQLISLFGDRVHQVALLFLVLKLTDSPAAVAAVLVVTTLPNLFLGPIAGAFVDRWDAREVMIVSDLLRAALVMAIPIAAVTNLLLVFPLVFLVTAISIFFRPARVSVLTRIVDDDDLLAANSALWVGETIADIGGYPLAGLFVAFLGPSLPLAFWIDGATYGASAVLIFSIVVRPLARTLSGMRGAGETPGTVEAAAGGEATGYEAAGVGAAGVGAAGVGAAGVGAAGVGAAGVGAAGVGAAGVGAAGVGAATAEGIDAGPGEPDDVAVEPAGTGLRGRWAVLREAEAGWAFLRGETVLLANTVQAVVGQVMIGIVLTLLPLYARDTIRGGAISPEAIYSFLEAGIGAGNLVGGFAIGLLGSRLRLGRLVIAGYMITGGLVALMSLTGNLGLALGLIVGVGVGNLVFVIPSQTLFQQRTPPELMGRVIGLRYSLTFGAMTLGIALAGVLGEALGPATVIGVFGLLTFWSGVAGLIFPAVRDA